jgi:CBS domain-containing protein
MTINEEEFEAKSEFEESYDLPSPNNVTETFSAELLEDTLETLRPAKPICVDSNELLEKVILGMGERNQGCVLVTENGELAGIFTERDLLRKVFGRVDPKTTRIKDVMTRDPEAVSFHDTIAAALNKMTVGGFRHVPLVDIQRRPVGVVSVKDIVQYFVRHFPRHVLNIAPDPTVRHPGEPAGAG